MKVYTALKNAVSPHPALFHKRLTARPTLRVLVHRRWAEALQNDTEISARPRN